MERVALLGAAERRDLFRETGARRGMNPAIAEKDFWVCWVLKRLFADPVLRDRIVFKGGTTLSKVFGLIDRFSEDIDLVLDWRLLGYGADLEDPYKAHASAAQQDKFNKAVNAKAAAYIAGPLLERLKVTLAAVEATADDGNPHIIDITYPAAFREEYLRPEVRLEIGPLASWVPSSVRTIRPYAAESLPHVFVEPSGDVLAMDAQRTFWEKATILHQQAHRPNAMPPRYSRHYYDLYKLAMSDIGRNAAHELETLADVVAFKRRFYPSAWASYESAVPGTLRLTPREDQLMALRRDYEAMSVMIFGGVTPFDEILRGVAELEARVNRAPREAALPAGSRN